MPIKSTQEAIAKYVGKYISKHIEARLADDRGVRLVRYSQGARAGTTRFQFKSVGSAQWRLKVSIFAEYLKASFPEHTIECLSDISKLLGKRWAYHYRDHILGIPA